MIPAKEIDLWYWMQSSLLLLLLAQLSIRLLSTWEISCSFPLWWTAPPHLGRSTDILLCFPSPQRESLSRRRGGSIVSVGPSSSSSWTEVCFFPLLHLCLSPLEASLVLQCCLLTHLAILLVLETTVGFPGHKGLQVNRSRLQGKDRSRRRGFATRTESSCRNLEIASYWNEPLVLFLLHLLFRYISRTTWTEDHVAT